jgi:hypothetical protein
LAMRGAEGKARDWGAKRTFSRRRRRWRGGRSEFRAMKGAHPAPQRTVRDSIDPSEPRSNGAVNSDGSQPRHLNVHSRPPRPRRSPQALTPLEPRFFCLRSALPKVWIAGNHVENEVGVDQRPHDLPRSSAMISSVDGLFDGRTPRRRAITPSPRETLRRDGALRSRASPSTTSNVTSVFGSKTSTVAVSPLLHGDKRQTWIHVDPLAAQS